MRSFRPLEFVLTSPQLVGQESFRREAFVERNVDR